MLNCNEGSRDRIRPVSARPLRMRCLPSRAPSPWRPRGRQPGAAEQRCRRSAEPAATSAAERGRALPARSQGCLAGPRGACQRVHKRPRSTVTLAGTQRSTEQRSGQGSSNANRRTAPQIGASCKAAAAAAPHTSLSCSRVVSSPQQRTRPQSRAALAPAAPGRLTCGEQRRAAARPRVIRPRRAAQRVLPPFLTHARPFGAQKDGARALWRQKLVPIESRRARPPSRACCTAAACPAARVPLAALCRTRCASAAPCSASTSTPRARSTCKRRSAMSSTPSSCGACRRLCCARGRRGRLVAGASRRARVCRH